MLARAEAVEILEDPEGLGGLGALAVAEGMGFDPFTILSVASSFLPALTGGAKKPSGPSAAQIAEQRRREEEARRRAAEAKAAADRKLYLMLGLAAAGVATLGIGGLGLVMLMGRD